MHLQKHFIYYLFFAVQIFAQHNAALIEIDHLPIVVNDLKSAKAKMIENGFTIKQGYRHKNGITNSHIKFADKTALELISISNPSDDIALSYQKFLKNGEGGTFLSFRINNFDSVKSVLEKNKIKFEIFSTKVFTYITFTEPELQHIFFIEYKYEFPNDSLFTTHSNKTKGIAEVSLAGNSLVLKLLNVFGTKTNFGDCFRFDEATVSVRISEKEPLRVLGTKLFDSSSTIREFELRNLEIISE